MAPPWSLEITPFCGSWNMFPQREIGMPRKETANNPEIVDKALVAIFLKMSPEERLQANDNAVRTILELRHAYEQQRNDRTTRLKRNT